jgi:polyphosphate kinase 2 (PPK2 family)
MLERVDLSLRLEREAYRKQLRKLQVELHRRAFRLYERRRPLILVCEGWDAAGKGGAIRRGTEKLDPRSYQVFSIAAPTEEELAHHYLWRFWRRLMPPREKQIMIFDRSWYGRVLVERVEGFAMEQEWRRAYREINDFERQLVDAEAFIVKLWFHISQDEQLSRFERRQVTAHKKWKLTDEDWRNRDKWDAYENAVEDMLLKTSTQQAPWTIVEGNDKRWARVKTLKTIVDALEPVASS